LSEADIQLLLTALGGVALLVALIVTRIRLHPLIALLVVSLAVGIAAGMDISSIAGATVAGAGHTLGVVGIVIALGAMLGKADSGVTEAIADAIPRRSSDTMLPWAMAFAAFIVGIPMFFEVGLVVLLPLIFSVARKLENKGTVKGSPYDGRSDQDDIRHPVYRRTCWVGHGTTHEPVSCAAVMISPPKEIWRVVSAETARNRVQIFDV
jgi:GntP family gluconate:H+ symporter